MDATPTSELQIHYVKISTPNFQNMEKDYIFSKDDLEIDYHPFSLKHLQNYNPIYSHFFEINETNYNNITLNHKYLIHDLTTVIDLDARRANSENSIIPANIFIKFSPLLDICHYCVGKYNLKEPALKRLPTIKNASQCFPKMCDPNNASYVDSFFAYLSSRLLHKYGFIHANDYYGSFLAMQDLFKANVGGDLDYLITSEFFLHHVGRDFFLSPASKHVLPKGDSRHNKPVITIGDDAELSLDDIVSLDHLENSPESNYKESKQEEIEENELHLETNNDSSDEDDDEEETDSEPNYSEDGSNARENDSDKDIGDELVSYSSCDDSEDEMEDEEDVFLYMKDYPVQLICLEKCDGTLDSLFMEDAIDENIGASCLFQVVMTLAMYQRHFKFTHNDLHTNNIMYCNTDIEYLFYKYNGNFYKVPTYGYIFKIIDFGRSIYDFNGIRFCSDSFSPLGDAHTQYNCEPYYDETKKRVEPNYSFDLCRLACSIYDSILDPYMEISEIDSLDLFKQTIHRWCKDDNGKNVLYKKDGEERYPNFKLYKMIARTVHKHTPENQMKYKLFQQFLVSPTEEINDKVMYI